MPEKITADKKYKPIKTKKTRKHFPAIFRIFFIAENQMTATRPGVINGKTMTDSGPVPLFLGLLPRFVGPPMRLIPRFAGLITRPMPMLTGFVSMFVGLVIRLAGSVPGFVGLVPRFLRPFTALVRE
jgi:hypothetical protein